MVKQRAQKTPIADTVWPYRNSARRQKLAQCEHQLSASWRRRHLRMHCSSGEIGLLHRPPRSVKIPHMASRFQNTFTENMSHNKHFWPQSIANERKKKVQHPTEVPTRRTTVTMSQGKQKTFNRAYIFSFPFCELGNTLCKTEQMSGITHLFYCLLYPP